MGIWYGGLCTKNHSEKQDYNTFGTVLHVQTNTINLQILSHKCQKYLASFTDIPYKAGTVNHATMNKMVKITDTIFVGHMSRTITSRVY